jgi:cellulose synthase/poly-beta-1,6-N-acetylglucosamine synthase-like glycosyltransferase
VRTPRWSTSSTWPPAGWTWPSADWRAVGALVALAAATTVALWRALDAVRARPPRGGRRLPAMLVIRPVRGLEPGLDGNVAAALAQRYPGRLETIFVLDDPADPAYPVLRERLARAPGRARIVLRARCVRA